MSGMRRSAVALILCSTLALGVAAAAFPQAHTTGPGSRIRVYVKMTDSKMVIALYALSDYHGPTELYMLDPANVVRGEVATFTVTNAGKKPHNFVFLGKKTGVLKPGKKGKFTVSLLRRGKFPYKSTVNHAKGLTGALIVN